MWVAVAGSRRGASLVNTSRTTSANGATRPKKLLVTAYTPSPLVPRLQPKICGMRGTQLRRKNKQQTLRPELLRVLRL